MPRMATRIVVDPAEKHTGLGWGSGGGWQAGTPPLCDTSALLTIILLAPREDSRPLGARAARPLPARHSAGVIAFAALARVVANSGRAARAPRPRRSCTSASPRCVPSVLRGESPYSTDLTPEQRAGGAPLPSDTHQRRPMLAEEPSAVRQGVMALAIGLALYAQLAVHKTPEDVVSWLAFAVAAVLAALVAGQRERPAAATLPDGAAWRGSAVRLALGADRKSVV